jgi:hypothetical protein
MELADQLRRHQNFQAKNKLTRTVMVGAQAQGLSEPEAVNTLLKSFEEVV